MTITPERAADATEALWETRAKGEVLDSKCGWCVFATQQPDRRWFCDFCPVARVFRQTCAHNTTYRIWSFLGGRPQAAAVYALLVENRERLIAAAREILDEAER